MELHDEIRINIIFSFFYDSLNPFSYGFFYFKVILLIKVAPTFLIGC